MSANPPVVELTFTCDTRLAQALLHALAPLVNDGTLDAEDATKIIASAVRIATVQSDVGPPTVVSV